MSILEFRQEKKAPQNLRTILGNDQRKMLAKSETLANPFGKNVRQSQKHKKNRKKVEKDC